MSILPPPDDRTSVTTDELVIGAGYDFTDPTSPLARYYLRASHIVAVVLIAIVFLLINIAPLWHTDIWGHLAYGRFIVDNRALPEKDPFSPFAEADAPGVRAYWLGQSALYLIYHAGERLAGGDDLERMAGGVAALRFAHALLTVLRFAILYVAFCRLSGSSGMATLALLVAIALNFTNLVILRPQVLAELFFACLLLMLSRQVLSRAAVVFVPLLMVLWANAHGSYVCGLMLLGVATAGRAWEAFWLRRQGELPDTFSDPQFRRLLIVLAASVAAVALLNPLGPRIFLDTRQMSNQPNVHQMDEWQPLRFDLAWGGQWAYIVSATLLVMTPILSRRFYTLSSLLFITAFALPPLLHQRLFVWWVMVAPWLMVRYWPDFSAERQSVPCFRKTIVAGLLILVALAWSIPTLWLLDGKPTSLTRAVTDRTPWPLTYQLRHGGDDERGMPALQQHLAKHYPEGRFTGTLFTTEHLGDQLVWNLAPEVPVYLYSHVHLFSSMHWQRSLHIRHCTAYCAKLLEAYRVNLIVVEPVYTAKFCEMLRQDAEWKVLVDPANEEKRDPRMRLLIAVRVKPK